ncbi:MAG: ABC transporter permease [Bacteroidia bacterium]|nr:ABC transporter permease [Bacteroidia bacterium]
MSNPNQSFSFSAYAWSQFKKNKPAYLSLYIFLVLAGIALFAPFLANDQPLYAKYKGHTLFPAFSFQKVYELDGTTIQLDIADWKKMELDQVIWAPVPYSPGKSDLLNIYAGPGSDQLFNGPSGAEEMPGRFRHFLGTSKRGEDLLSGLIHGTRISLTIGIFSMGIATILGLILGAMAGYFGDDKLKTKRGIFWLTLLGLIVAYFYGFMTRGFELADGLANSAFGAFFIQFLISLLIFISIIFLFNRLGKLLSNLPFFKESVSIPVDSLVSRFIEILISTPRLVLIISIAAIAKPSILILMVIIGSTSWTEIARFTRAEFLKIKNLEYIQAGQALGFNEVRIIFKHALPNGIAPALVAIAFGIASAILVESGLSFLGIGVPPDVVTWGSLVNAGRENFQAWWLVIYPGLAIFITVTIYNLLGEGLRDALDPRLKK